MFRPRDSLVRMNKPQPQPERPAEWDPVYGDREAFLKAVQEGITSLDAGYYIPHEEIEAWIDSWDTDYELPPPEPKRRAPRRR